MKILVGIVTYNRKNTLAKSIAAHLSDGISESDILVVDNMCTDDTVQLIREKFPLISVILNGDNIGSAGGFAVCMNYAREKRYDFVWLYNDDSYPLPGSNALMRKQVSDLLKRTPRVGMLKMGMLRNGKSEASFWRGRRVTTWIARGNIPVRTDLITFDGCMIRVALINEIGTCDPLFFMGVYEFDFCLRALDVGYNIFTLPAGLIEDQKMGSSNGSPPWRMYYVTRNQLYLGIKRKSFWTIVNFVVMELKKVVSIVFLQDNKVLKLRLKGQAISDAITHRMGKQVIPS